MRSSLNSLALEAVYLLIQVLREFYQTLRVLRLFIMPGHCRKQIAVLNIWWRGSVRLEML